MGGGSVGAGWVGIGVAGGTVGGGSVGIIVGGEVGVASGNVGANVDSSFGKAVVVATGITVGSGVGLFAR